MHLPETSLNEIQHSCVLEF